MPVHMRNGRAYGGIPNGTVKAETPSSVPTTVKQLNVVGAVGDIAPVTIPEAVKFENGNTLEDAVENFAQIETSPTTSTHAVGTHLVWNGILYTVKTAIDAGENLVINSNIERTYVADELESLNEGLNNLTAVTTTYRNFTLAANAKTILTPTPPTVPTGYRAVLLAAQLAVNTKDIIFQGVANNSAMFYSTFSTALSGNDFPLYCTWLVIIQ